MAELETLQEEVSGGPAPTPISSLVPPTPLCFRRPQKPVDQTPFSLVRETPGSQ